MLPITPTAENRCIWVVCMKSRHSGQILIWRPLLHNHTGKTWWAQNYVTPTMELFFNSLVTRFFHLRSTWDLALVLNELYDCARLGGLVDLPIQQLREILLLILRISSIDPISSWIYAILFTVSKTIEIWAITNVLLNIAICSFKKPIIMARLAKLGHSLARIQPHLHEIRDVHIITSRFQYHDICIPSADSGEKSRDEHIHTTRLHT